MLPAMIMAIKNDVIVAQPAAMSRLSHPTRGCLLGAGATGSVRVG
jgi:hypothetical protein